LGAPERSGGERSYATAGTAVGAGAAGPAAGPAAVCADVAAAVVGSDVPPPSHGAHVRAAHDGFPADDVI